MPLDPELVAETRSWLEKASNDLRAADTLRKAEPPLLSEAALHCQQATEKVLKAFLTWHNTPFAKTHNLTDLGQACVQIDPNLATSLARAAPLSEFAWKFRYPGSPAEPASGLLSAETVPPLR